MESGKKNSSGFTLIELMIVVAIIAILATIALQSGYVAYVVRSQVVAGLSDIRGGKAGLEVAFNEGRASDVDAAYIGLRDSTSRCSTISASVDSDGAGEITCTLIGNDVISGLDIQLLRSSSGLWSCDASALLARYRPEGCS